MFSPKLSPKIQQEMVRQVRRAIGQRRNKASAVSPALQDPEPISTTDGVRPFSEMPGPKSFPLIGTQWMSFRGGPLHGLLWYDKVCRLQEMYGNIIREEVFPGYNLVHLFDPRDFEQIYRNEGKFPIRESFHMMKIYNTKYNDGIQGIITSQGEDWHRLRSQVQHKMLKPKAVSAYLTEQNEVATDFVDKLRELRDEEGVIEDVLQELYKFSMESIGIVCFNKRFGTLATHLDKNSDTARFIQSVNDVFAATYSETKNFLFHFFETPTFKKLARAQTFIRELTWRSARDSLARYAAESREGTIDGEHGDLIPYLLSKTKLSEKEAITVVGDFFFGGVDTTSHLLGFAMYALSRSPEKQAKLLAEIDEKLPDHAQPTEAILSRMSYLRAVIKETLRMTPIAPGNGRNLSKDIVLRDYHIPAKTMVALHHDWSQKQPEYFDSPHDFVPERWLRGQGRRDGNPFAFMPFGFGPRMCPGKRIAEQEVSLALIKIFQNFTLEYKHTDDLRYDMCIINVPQTPLKFRFVNRK